MLHTKTSLFFAVRKYLGISQDEMAQAFGFSQSKIARIENRKTQIWDHEWDSFLKKINVSENNNPYFFIHETETLDSLYKKIHHIERDSFTPSVKMRSAATALHFIRAELGKEKILNELFDEYTLFKNFHQILDFKIHPLYFEQFSAKLVEENLLNFEAFDEISKFHTQISSMSLHSQAVIKQNTIPYERIKQVCSHAGDYVDYEYYSFHHCNNQFIIRKHYKIPRLFQMTTICNYETNYLEQIANYGSLQKNFTSSKTKCYFNGDDCCEYVLND